MFARLCSSGFFAGFLGFVRRRAQPAVRAIVEAAEQEGGLPPAPADFESVTGMGVRATVDGARVEVGSVAPLQEVLFGPSKVADGTTNLVGALRRAMATTGYTEVKELQRIEVVVAPHQPS